MRGFIFLATLLCALFGPWWGVLIGATAVSLRYRAYEMLLVGAIADVLWLPNSLAWGMPLMLYATIAIIWILEPVRRELFITDGLG